MSDIADRIEGLRILHREQIREATPRPTMWSELADLIEAQAARISELERKVDEAWHAFGVARQTAGEYEEQAAFEETRADAAEAERDRLRSVITRISERVPVYRETAPEGDETWESWYFAAFDLLSDEIARAALAEPSDG
jgi:chromosome segregation ATPase